jgi:superfamily II RNA helicase
MPRKDVNKQRRKHVAENKRRRAEGRRKENERALSSATKETQTPASPPPRLAARPRELRRLLEGIGTPHPAPFKPDPFQLEALAALEHEDVLVTAPTGSGKTWIAREEIRRLLDTNRRAWYTSPLKALTNSKYQEFVEEFGPERVGILTGDRKENGDAPLIVGTTEIYRNQLFDSLRSGSNIRADLVVLDEAHYLADEERGHVWEEAIILSPPRVRLLLLSATIGNAEEFASWISEVRGVPCGVVSRPGARPVPLRAAFLLPDGQLLPLLSETGGLNPEIARLGEREKQERREQRSARPFWRTRKGRTR